MRPPSAAQSRAGAVAPAPRGFPVVACPDSIARDTRCLLLTHTSIRCCRRLAKRHLPLVVRLVLWLVRLGLAVAPALHSPLVQMRVVPAHGSLNDRVQAFERQIATDPDAPPDRRPNLGQRDLELVDGSRGGVFHLTASVVADRPASTSLCKRPTCGPHEPAASQRRAS